MSHPIFDQRPWLDRAAPLPDRIVGMLGQGESSLFYHLARDWFTGRGTIVDAGSFLGKSAICFALGLRGNPRFDARRDRVHCFDDFVCHDDQTVELVGGSFGAPLTLGQSTRRHFDQQVSSVQDLLEVHAGDFAKVAFAHRPIEILMVDIAKSEDLGRHVVEKFFPDLVPGHSLVLHQDYHHAWLPHIHVVMEFLADCFELVVPRVDCTTVFRLVRPIPASLLERAIAYDFTADEKVELMRRAIDRLPDGDRADVELARVVLLAKLWRFDGLRLAIEHNERRRSIADRNETWHRELAAVREFVDVEQGKQQCARSDFAAAMELADGAIGKQPRSVRALELRAMALAGLDRRDEAEAALAAMLRVEQPHAQVCLALARVYRDLGRWHDAETVVLQSLADLQLTAEERLASCDVLCAVWEQHRQPEREDEILARLRCELPGETEVDLLAARSAFLRADLPAALRHMQAALGAGASRERCAELLLPLGLTPEAVMALRVRP